MKYEEDPPSCDFCYTEGVKLTECACFPANGETRMVCDVCANSGASRYVTHARWHDSEQGLMRAICVVGNMVLKAIRESDRGASRGGKGERGAKHAEP